MASPKTIVGGDDVRAIVADCGSWVTRVGAAGDDSPRAIVPSAVGIPFPPKPAQALAGDNERGTGDVEMTDSNAGGSASAAGSSAEQREKLREDVDMKDETVGKPAPPKTAAKAARRFFAGDYVLTSPTGFPDVQSVYAFDSETGTATVQNWDAMQAVWEAAFSALRLNAGDCPLMIVEPSRPWKDEDRARALERAFEGCGVSAAYLGRGSAMAAFASARTTACVLDIGYQGATAVPVVDGYTLRKSTKTSAVGGRLLSEQLLGWAETQLASKEPLNVFNPTAGDDRRMPQQKGRLRAHHEVHRVRIASPAAVRKYTVTDLSLLEPQLSFTDAHRSFYRLRIMDEMKTATFQVTRASSDATAGGTDGNGSNSGAGNGSDKSKNGKKDDDATGDGAKGDVSVEKETKEKSRDKSNGGGRSTSYALPDGNFLSLEESGGKNIANSLFVDSNEHRSSITGMVFNAVSSCDVDVRRDLFSGVVVTGGTSMIPGLVERLTTELAITIPQAYKLKIIGSQNSMERTCGAWIGGSIVSSLGTFQQAWVSKAEYDELGSMTALRKCP